MRTSKNKGIINYSQKAFIYFFIESYCLFAESMTFDYHVTHIMYNRTIYE